MTVQAISIVDSSISATAQVTITQGPPVITQISPDTANASDQINILGNSLNFIGSTTTVFFTGPNGVLLPVLSTQRAPHRPCFPSSCRRER